MNAATLRYWVALLQSMFGRLPLDWQQAIAEAWCERLRERGANEIRPVD